MSAQTVVLATGGTGGHIYPALALAGRLGQAGVQTVLIGSRGGLEEKLADDSGVEFLGVSSGKLDRQRPDPRELQRAVRGVLQARTHLRRIRPGLVLGFGGFASLPASAAASWLKLPLWLVEQNAHPGLVTRLLASRAELVITNIAAAGKRLKARKLRVIPYAVDELRPGRAEARSALGLPPSGLVTLVMGGSQGSVAINTAVLAARQQLGQAAPYTLHVTGPANLETVRLQSSGQQDYRAVGYVDGRLAFAAADMAITRAGTGTLSMAAFHGVPLLMIPLPTSSENHQFHNAETYLRAGAGILLPQADLDGLAGAWLELLEPGRLEAARQAISTFTPAGALDEFTEAVLGRLHSGVPA